MSSYLFVWINYNDGSFRVTILLTLHWNKNLDCSFVATSGIVTAVVIIANVGKVTRINFFFRRKDGLIQQAKCYSKSLNSQMFNKKVKRNDEGK